MDDWAEECTLAARETARLALPATLDQIEYQAERLARESSRTRGIAGRLRQALAGLTGHRLPEGSRPWPIIEVTLAPADADALEGLIRRIQAHYPGETEDDCVDSLMASAIAHAAALTDEELKAALDIAPRGVGVIV
jgi:hypothetical protein